MGLLKGKFTEFASRIGRIVKRKKTDTIEEKPEEELVIENPAQEREDKRIEIVETHAELPRKAEEKIEGLSVPEQMEVDRFVQTIKEEKIKYSEKDLRTVLREEGLSDKVIEGAVKRLVENG